MTGDSRDAPVDRRNFPYMRVRDKVALIGVSSARATAPFMASGYFREEQARRLGEMLDETAEQGLFRVVMIHHPPVRGAVASHKRLFGIGNFQKIVRRHGAELVLHGHSHDPSLNWIEGKEHKVPVVGVSAAGQSVGGSKAPAQWNLLEISGEPGAWSLRLARRGLTGPTVPIREISSETLLAPAKAGQDATG